MRPKLPASSRSCCGTHDHRGDPPKTERPESLRQERPINHLVTGRQPRQSRTQIRQGVHGAITHPPLDIPTFVQISGSRAAVTGSGVIRPAGCRPRWLALPAEEEPVLARFRLTLADASGDKRSPAHPERDDRFATNALVCAGRRRRLLSPRSGRVHGRRETTPSSPEQPRWKGPGPAISPPLSDKQPLRRSCVVDADSRARPARVPHARRRRPATLAVVRSALAE